MGTLQRMKWTRDLFVSITACAAIHTNMIALCIFQILIAVSSENFNMRFIVLQYLGIMLSQMHKAQTTAQQEGTV